MSNHDEPPPFMVRKHPNSSEQVSASLRKQSVDCGIASDVSAGPKDSTDWVKSVKKEAKLKTKKLFRIDDTRQRLQDNPGGAPRKIQDNPGFNPSKTLNAESSTISHLKDQLPDNMQQLAQILRHPKSATKGKASKTLATSEEPYLSRSDDEHLLSAHEKLERASASHDENSEDDESQDDLKKTIDDMEESRKTKRVAWTSSRYVHRARVVTPGYHKFPVLSSCRWVDSNGEPQGSQWSQWFHHIRLLFRQAWVDSSTNNSKEELGWNQDLLLQQAERIVMASSPWQKCLSRLCRLWQWENPKRTAAWFAIWLVVWYNNRIFTFIYSTVIYTIIKQRLGPKRRGLLQRSHDRAGDDDATPNTFGEMISRHGSTDWLDPMLEYVGPKIQPQVRDLADWMEVFMNFYEWKTPRATAATLFLMGSAIALATFANTDLNMRILTLTAIVLFFTYRPISSRYSNYPQVIAPLHWIFWDIPTHSETSFRYLRMQAEDMRKATYEKKSDSLGEILPSKPECATSGPILASPPKSAEDKCSVHSITRSVEPTEHDIFAARCHWDTISGNVVVSLDGIRFVRKVPKKEIWKRQFNELLEIKKGDGKTSIIKKTQNFLELHFVDGSSGKLENLEKKDELFNIIIAFSGLTWQEIQP